MTSSLIDPYNDFISQGGKLWDRLKTVVKQMVSKPRFIGTVLSAAMGALLATYSEPGVVADGFF